jgi:GH15 family glucan-1,4-alpha-glucosidase
VFLDDRFGAERSPATLDLLTRLAHKAVEVAGTPDSGIWEIRRKPRTQTFSSLMCWAAADRMAAVVDASRGDADGLRAAADRIRDDILARAWNPKVGSFVSSYDGRHLDAALLQMAGLRLLPPRDPRLLGTIDAVRSKLSRGDWLMRYRTNDGLGLPKVAFILCTFWLVEALVVVDRVDEARSLLQHALSALSPLGLLSEDYQVEEGRMSGNFPQAYSHVGLIHAAFAASPRWSSVL